MFNYGSKQYIIECMNACINESNNLIEDLEIITKLQREDFKIRPEEDGAKILGNLVFKFFIVIKILSCPFLFSSLATVMIFGKESLKIASAFVLNSFSILLGCCIPGKITLIFDESIPTLIAKSLVKFELATMKFALFVLLIISLFNDEPIS